MKIIVGLLFAVALGWGAYEAVYAVYHLMPSAGELITEGFNWSVEACLDGNPWDCRYLRDVERMY